MALVAKNFQDIITFSRASSGTYVNNNGYITNSAVLNYLTYSNQPENAAWTKSNSFVQQNVLTYSQEFDNAAWSKLSVAAIANTTISPDGTLTADTITVSAGSSAHNLQQAGGGSGAPITLSVYAKAGTHSFIQLSQGSAGGLYANFDVSTGTLGTVGGSATATITAAANGFYRCSMTITPGAVANIRVGFVTSSTAAYTEVWTAAGTETVFLWGAQLVQGSVPGDYRATTTAALPCLYADYNGALRARKLCENTANAIHVAYEILAKSAGVATYTGSILFKAADPNRWMRILVSDAATANYSGVFFDPATGTVASSVVNVGFTGGTASITSLGSGWYRAALTTTTDAVSTGIGLQVYLANSSSTTTYTGDGSSGIYIADAQLNDGSSALAYYDTTASAYNAPRFDYDPVTLAAKGLLVEESRTNLLLQSQDISAAAYTRLNLVTTNYTNLLMAPDGTLTMDAMMETTTPTVYHGLYQTITKAASSITYAYSLFVRDKGRQLVVALQDAAAANGVFARFNPATGTVTAPAAAFGTGFTAGAMVVENWGGGLYRVTLTATSDASTSLRAELSLHNGTTNTYTGDGTSGVYVWGQQVEAGAFATSYIPTTASQVTRAADVASVNTLSPWFNQAGGTIYVEADTFEPSVVAVRNAVAINDGSSNNVHRVLSYGGKIGGNTITASATVADLQPLTYTTNTTFKFAYAYAANDFAAVGNGGAPSTDVLGALPTGLTTMGIGNLSGVIWCGHMRRITYYPRRLTNAELQTLTTL